MSTEVETEDVVGDWEVDDVGEIDTSGAVATGDGGAASGADTSTEDCVLAQEQAVEPDNRATEPATIAEQYIASLRDQSSLHVTISGEIANAFDKNAEYGVFSLFFTGVFKE
ncbi:hypothetical protein JG687_00018828 [Phytophthora cactorum]|uniref:Uncharacterized protein n=1 Tax=Phytophthora cactorum TaxID=29920 RepID=A0A329RER7_9STRA|nr:hypothetical protein Pcac1_g17818 [Phytophthora cactorum]KAG2817284.1 hypothetical protein PC111_g12772 [Phytophthora cactorum]KAG2841763.1 hypothetical protein PC112_g3232 [Phytophthora cactorum]KAG2858552.1 hypothetical protein PC113_g9722 [Phytophthora cactorum]KAG2896682.1 hypothetical protein PC114_g14989 [Phytophthora cactorum]